MDVIADAAHDDERGARVEMFQRAGERTDHGAQFMPAVDSRNRRVPGLCTRNGRYYAQLWVDLGNGRKSARRLPLLDDNQEPIRSLTQAKDAARASLD